MKGKEGKKNWAMTPSGKTDAATACKQKLWVEALIMAGQGTTPFLTYPPPNLPPRNKG